MLILNKTICQFSISLENNRYFRKKGMHGSQHVSLCFPAHRCKLKIISYHKVRFPT